MSIVRCEAKEVETHEKKINHIKMLYVRHQVDINNDEKLGDGKGFKNKQVEFD